MGMVLVWTFGGMIFVLFIALPVSQVVAVGCKTHDLHHPIRDWHISILLKIQYILTHLITSQ